MTFRRRAEDAAQLASDFYAKGMDRAAAICRAEAAALRNLDGLGYEEAAEPRPWTSCYLRNPPTAETEPPERYAKLAAAGHPDAYGALSPLQRHDLRLRDPATHDRQRRAWLTAHGWDPVEASPAAAPRHAMVPAPKRGRTLATTPADRSVDGAWRPSLEPVARPLRRVLYRLRSALRRIQRPRIAACGYAMISTDSPGVGAGETVSVVVGEDGRARLCGLAHCGSVWECPTCRAAILSHRAAEVTRAVEGHDSKRIVMLTLTIRHGVGHSLRRLREKLADAYRALCRGAPWQRFKARMGISGTIRALEVTHGRANGWHPHLHVLWFLDEPPPRLEVYDVGTHNEWAFTSRAWLIDRWSEMVTRYVGPEHAPDPAVGVSVSPIVHGAYLAKLGLELSDPGTKRGKKGGRTPIEIAADWASDPSYPDGLLWQGYADAMRGARQLTWSKGLKARFAIAERSDAEITEDEGTQTGDRVVARLTGEQWRALRFSRWGASWILEQVEKGGAPLLRATIDDAITRARREAAERSQQHAQMQRATYHRG